MKTIRELTVYFKGILQARMKNPVDDPISALIKGGIEGQKLSEIEIINFCILLYCHRNFVETIRESKAGAGKQNNSYSKFICVWFEKLSPCIDQKIKK
jgi:hypothetical protein